MDWHSFIEPKSQKVEVSLTTHCNANCPLCLRTDPNTGVKKESLPLLHISFDVYKRFVDEIKPDPADDILLCGDYGDPLMHPQVEEIIDILYPITTVTLQWTPMAESGVQIFTKGLQRNGKKKSTSTFPSMASMEQPMSSTGSMLTLTEQLKI